MGEARRRKLAGIPSRVDARLNIMVLDEPDTYRPPADTVTIIADTPDAPMVAIELAAEQLQIVVDNLVDGARTARQSRRNIESMFFGALQALGRGGLDMQLGTEANIAGGLALSAAFYLAFTNAVETPGRAEVLRAGVDAQLEKYGAACVTLGVLLRPHSDGIQTSPRTRRWIIEPNSPPGYTNPNTVLGKSSETMH